jgi:hypothetical protein
MFSIRHDMARSLIRAELRGFWTVEMVDRYCDTLQEGIAARAVDGKRFGLLIDSREYPLQNAEVSARFVACTADWPPPGEGPVAAVAMIVASTLSKLQAERTIGAGVVFFHQPEEAEQWLAIRLGELGI